MAKAAPDRKNSLKAPKNLGPVLDWIPDFIYIVDEEFRIVYANKILIRGYPQLVPGGTLLNMTYTEAFPFMNDNLPGFMGIVFRTGEPFMKEEWLHVKERTLYAHTRLIPIQSGHKVTHIMVIVEDLTRQKELETLKVRSVQQKEVLIKEIHHRVKNNLAIVISLMSMQARQFPDPELKKVLNDVEIRIRSMALIHENLYETENPDRIPLDKYLRSLTSVISSVHCPENLEIRFDLIPVEVPLETATPLGLITCELLTNAFKYGIPAKGSPRVSVALEKIKENSHLRLTVADNGPGLPAGLSLNTATSMGLFILRILSEQLEAKVKIKRNKGTQITLEFRNPFEG
jgi:two-component sensor histidine kinase